jgi:23S rRNA (cytosine1962-C5)-methyltransferase
MQDKMEMFANRLTKVHKHLSKLAKRQHISCYRLYDKDLPEFPLIIEVYGDKIYLAEYKANHSLTEEAYEQWLKDSIEVIAKVVQVPVTAIFLKQRKRILDRTEQYQKLNTTKDYFVVQENGLSFQINLTDYLDTGLFLDHRITRKMVMDTCEDKKLLNLFCYTGSFSVYAAAGKAKEVWSIDLSNTYMDWTRANMAINNFIEDNKYRFIKADVLQYIEQLPDGYFDIIILDPPTFSNSKMMKAVFDVQRDHVGLINQLVQKITATGVIYFSNNFTQFQLDREAIPATTIKDITKQTTPFDFEKKLKRWCYKIERTMY